MRMLKNGLMILFLLLASTAMLGSGIAGAESNDEYIMNITIDDISLNFANHASDVNGNWIQLQGGDNFKLPSPMSFTYNGVNSSEFSIMGYPASVELNVDNYTDHKINYPYTTHPMYVNANGKNDVSFTFDGSTSFAEEYVYVSLIKANISELYSALDSKDDLQNLINSTEREGQYTLDGSGDLSVDYGPLNSGEYFIIIENFENGVLSATTFSVMEYESNVNIVENENSITTNINMLNAPASDYTYDAILIEENEYKAEMKMNFNGTEAGLNASMNGVPLLEGFSFTGLDFSNPTSADLKNKLNQSAGTDKIVLQDAHVSGNNTTLTLPTTGLAAGNYILLTTVRSGSDLLAFDQSEVNLTNYDFEMTVNTTSQTDETSTSTGGGSGAAISAEHYQNVESKDVDSKYIGRNVKAEYSFAQGSGPVENITFTPLINAGYTSVMVEVLKDTSTLVDTKPSGLLYSNINIWIGSRLNEDVIDNVTISFSVDKTWLDENDVDASNIRLLRYTTEWTPLSTTMTGEDEDKVYYTADTPGFSSFAIVADTDSAPVTEPAETEADFTAIPVEGKSPLEVTFTAEADNVDSWQWDFGDGNTSTQPNPTHTYEEPGTYTVVLTVEGEGGADVVEKTDLITVAAQEEDKGIPGFEAIFAIAGLLAVAGLLRRRKL